MPNVSLCVAENEVHYKPYVPLETKLVVYYDIQDISSPTTIFTNYDNSVKSIEVDGVLLDSVVTTYQFNSVGEHVIKYEFNNPTTVGNSAPLFHNLTTTKRVVIADTFTSIGSHAFYSCTGITSCTIGSGVTSIGEEAFRYCSGLTSVTIPDSVAIIGNYAFDNCTSLTSCTIGSASIGEEAFTDCSSLTSVTIGNGVTSIGRSAFSGCTSLTNCTIGSGVTSIGTSAFTSCSSLTTITSRIMSAPSVGGGTFYGVSNGGTLYVPIGSSGYETWMNNQGNLGYHNWTKVEQ